MLGTGPVVVWLVDHREFLLLRRLVLMLSMGSGEW